jgi:hypothetical protein
MALTELLCHCGIALTELIYHPVLICHPERSEGSAFVFALPPTSTTLVILNEVKDPLLPSFRKVIKCVIPRSIAIPQMLSS